MYVWIPILLNVLRYALCAGLAFLIFYKWCPGYFLPGKIQNKALKRADVHREILHSAQTMLSITLIAGLAIYTPLSQYTRVYFRLDEKPLWWIPLSVATMLLIHDTYFYWMHRAIHHPFLFKKIHSVHHKSTNPTPLAAYAFHFSESLLQGAIAPILLVLMPLHPLSMLIFSSLSFAFNVYGHLGYEITPKWFRKSLMFGLFNTATHHNLHHAQFKGNYGLYFRFWDKLMGTENPGYTATFDQIQHRRFPPKHGLPKTLTGTS